MNAENKGRLEGGCYFCGEAPVGVEHVPPRGFFPKAADTVRGTSLRANLITVPACREHNQDMSKDDEVAGYIILLHHNSNSVASSQFATKAIRAFTKKPGLVNRVFLGMRPAINPNGFRTAAVTIDAPLLSRVMEKIARGLYYSTHRKVWDSELHLVGDLLMPDLSPSPFAAHMTALRRHFIPLSRRGVTPAVFWWQDLALANGEHALRMCFYGGLEFYAFPKIPR
jgi:hypothetical protein